MLIRVIGFVPAFAGFAVTVAILPLAAVLGTWMTGIRKKAIGVTDQRVKLVTEILAGVVGAVVWKHTWAKEDRVGKTNCACMRVPLNCQFSVPFHYIHPGIKAIKLYAWEEPYRKLIEDVRDKASGAGVLERALMGGVRVAGHSLFPKLQSYS